MTKRDPLSVIGEKIPKGRIAEGDVTKVHNRLRSADVRIDGSARSIPIDISGIEPTLLVENRSRLLIYLPEYGTPVAICPIANKPSIFTAMPSVTLGDTWGGSRWSVKNSAGTEKASIDSLGTLTIVSEKLEDGITAPTAEDGWAYIYVDTADGKLKIKHGDGNVSTLEYTEGSLHDPISLAADANAFLALNDQEIQLDNQSANTVFAAPDGASGDPTFRTLVTDDINLFDATNPTTIGAGDTPAPGSADKAARRDHAHGITSTADGQTNPSTLLQVDANGRLRIANVGIGTSTSTIPAHILGTSGDQLRLAYDSGGYAKFTVADGGGLTVATVTDDVSGWLNLNPAGDLILDPQGDDVVPNLNYDINIGSASKKFLTLHVAELWTDTLVAEEKIGTVGGHILVAPTTKLAVDLSGTNLISNGGFETAGGGGADVFANWTENAGLGAITQDTGSYRDTYAAKLASGMDTNTYVYQEASVDDSKRYTYSFWTCGQGTYAGQYAIYDVTNAAWIQSITGTGVSGTTYERVHVSHSTPTDCETVRLYLYGPSIDGPSAWFDEVYIWESTISVEHNQMQSGDIAILDGQFTIEFVKMATNYWGSGPYKYGVLRDLDGTGANDWYAGDGIVNTGGTGDGFLDLYSINGVGRYLADDETGASWGPSNHGLSMYDGQAFINVVGVPLWHYAGTDSGDTNFTLTIRDTSGREARGYIGAQATGETVGSSITLNASFEDFTGTADDGNDDDFDDWNEVNIGSGDKIEAVTSPVYVGTYAAKLTYGNDGCLLSQAVTLTPGKLYRFRVRAAGDGSVAGSYSIYDSANSNWVVEKTSTGQTGTGYTLVEAFFTAVTSSANHVIRLYSPDASGYCVFDACYIAEVTECDNTGVHILSAKDGTTQNWAYIHSSFNYFDTSYKLWVRGSQGGWGPTIVGNVRNSLTFNDWSEYYALGNLNNLYGYGADTYGLGLGKYGSNHIVIDSTNGIRFRDSSDNVQAQLTSTTWTLGRVGTSLSNIQISAGALSLRNNTTERIGLSSAGALTIKDSGGAAVFTFDASLGAEFTKPLTIGTSGGIYQGTGTFASPTTGLKIWNDSGVGRVAGYNSGSIQAYFNTDGKLYAGAGSVVIDASGISIEGYGYLEISDSDVNYGTAYGVDAYPEIMQVNVEYTKYGTGTYTGGWTFACRTTGTPTTLAYRWYKTGGTVLMDLDYTAGDLRLLGGLAVGSTSLDPTAGEILYTGSLTSYKGSTEYNVFGMVRIAPIQGWTDAAAKSSQTIDTSASPWSLSDTASIKAYQVFFRYTGDDPTDYGRLKRNSSADAALESLYGDACGGIVTADTSGDFYFETNDGTNNTVTLWITGYYI